MIWTRCNVLLFSEEILKFFQKLIMACSNSNSVYPAEMSHMYIAVSYLVIRHFLVSYLLYDMLKSGIPDSPIYLH